MRVWGLLVLKTFWEARSCPELMDCLEKVPSALGTLDERTVKAAASTFT